MDEDSEERSSADSWEISFDQDDSPISPVTSTSAALCSACSSIFPIQMDLAKPQRREKHFEPFPINLGQLRQNAREDVCGVCLLLNQTAAGCAKTSVGLPNAPDESVIRYAIRGRDGIAREIEFEVTNALLPQPTRMYLHMAPLSDVERFVGTFEKNNENSTAVEKTKSNNSWPSCVLSRMWLVSCFINHDRCKVMSPVFLPTRLIYLGENPSVVRPKLVLSKNLKDKPAYCTLSHCWGATQQLKLTKASLEGMQSTIPITKLSPTFKQAMETVRRLNFCYIWIDSLCIIQDDDDELDWRAEASMMGDIYQHSTLNIAATKASSGEDGLWSKRFISQITPCRIETIPLPGHETRSQTYVLWSSDTWRNAIDGSPLLSRGWVTQEITLARRNLHFADGQMVWQCEQKEANETFPWGIPRKTNTKPSTNVEGLSPTQKTPYDPTREKYMVWDEVVSQFTSATLTYPQKDKLIALSSVASKIGLDDELVAGLWRKRLPYQLLWRVGGLYHAEIERPLAAGKYQAPSWSWASVNGPISPQKPEHTIVKMLRIDEASESGHREANDDDVYLSVVDVDLDYKDGDPRAQLLRGVLTVWGPLTKLTLTRVTESKSKKRYRFGNTKISIHGDIYDECWKLKAEVSAYCLWVLGQNYEDYQAYGIFLHPSVGDTGEYIRLGLLYVTNPMNPAGNTKENMLAIFREGLDEGDDGYMSIDRDQPDGMPRYLISIV